MRRFRGTDSRHRVLKARIDRPSVARTDNPPAYYCLRIHLISLPVYRLAVRVGRDAKKKRKIYFRNKLFLKEFSFSHIEKQNQMTILKQIIPNTLC